MGKRKFEYDEINQLGELQDIIKHARYHYDMIYFDDRIIYGHSFLDFEDVIMILKPDVELSAYNQVAGHVGDMYDALKDMRKTRTTIRKDDKRIELYDEKINKTMELLKINNTQREQIFSDWYKHLDILKSSFNYEWIPFPEKAIEDITENKSYDLTIANNKIITLAKETIPLIKPNKRILYTNISEYDVDDLFHVALNISVELMDIYILIAAFKIPE